MNSEILTGLAEPGRRMQSMKKVGPKHAVIQKPKGSPIVAEVGLVLMDLSHKIIALDRGAAAILNSPNQPGLKVGAFSNVPPELLNILRNRKPADRGCDKTHVRLGKGEYICRTYVLESPDASQPILALHLEKDSSASDAIFEVVNKYHLTDREQEVLRGISMGLATKELAGRMNISPNTVKAFLRLVMIKMGVTTRAGIVAKILHNGSAPPEEEERDEPADAAPQQVRKRAV